MIDIDLIMESVEWNSLRGFGWQNSSVTYDEMYQIITRLRQAEKDAARYRWLRESASTEDHGGFAYNFRLVDAIRYMPGAAPNETMDIDVAIDEAMQCN